MRLRRDPIDPETREKALKWLQSGEVALPDLAKLLGTSTQTIWNWCREQDIDWRKAREAWLAREWRQREGRSRKSGR